MRVAVLPLLLLVANSAVVMPMKSNVAVSWWMVRWVKAEKLVCVEVMVSWLWIIVW